MEIIRYQAAHLLGMEPTMDAEQYAAFTTPALAKSLEGPFARTAFADRRPIACAGLVSKWVDNWIAWAYLSRDAGKYMFGLTKNITKLLPDMPAGRIEATTPMDYAAGRRWLEMLGFNLETPEGMKHYTPDGRSFGLYSRINLK